VICFKNVRANREQSKISEAFCYAEVPPNIFEKKFVSLNADKQRISLRSMGKNSCDLL